MTFLHPSFLWGLIGLSVPFILHFLLRRRVRQVRFSSLALLRLLQQKRSKRMRLAQLLLLILRLLIVATVVLLFAHLSSKQVFSVASMPDQRQLSFSWTTLLCSFEM